VSAPAVIITLELEQRARVRFEADSADDERRLRQWLLNARARHELPLAVLDALLDDDLQEELP
jgi:hypothetical protein